MPNKIYPSRLISSYCIKVHLNDIINVVKQLESFKDSSKFVLISATAECRDVIPFFYVSMGTPAHAFHFSIAGHETLQYPWYISISCLLH